MCGLLGSASSFSESGFSDLSGITIGKMNVQKCHFQVSAKWNIYLYDYCSYLKYPFGK